MSLIWKDRVLQTVSGTPGTGPFTLSTAVAAYQALNALDNAKTGWFCATEGNAWQTFWGTYTHSGTSLAVTQIIDSSVSGAAVSFTAAAVVFLDIISQAANQMAVAASAVTPGGRLTLLSGSAVPSGDVTGATAVLWTPNGTNGGVLPQWDTRIWTVPQVPEFGGALGTKTSGLPYDDFAFSVTLTPSSTNTGTDIVTYGSAHNLLTGAWARSTDTIGGLTYGVDYWVNVASSTTLSFHATLADALAGTSKVDLTANITQAIQFVSKEHIAWTNGSTRATALTDQERTCKSGDKTRLYLGSFYTTSTTATEDSLLNRLLFNNYNERNRKLKAVETTSHTINNVGPREWNNGTAARAYFFNGLQRDVVRQFISVIMQTSTTSYAVALPSLNSAAGELDARFRLSPAPTAVDISLNASVVHSPALGLNYLTVLEQEVVAADATFVAVTNEGVCRA